MTHYAEDFEMSSPVIRQLMNIESGKIKGKKAVKTYWEKAMAKIPDLHFEFIEAFAGVNSVVIKYKGHRCLSAELFFFDSVGKVESAFAHYE